MHPKTTFLVTNWFQEKVWERLNAFGYYVLPLRRCVNASCETETKERIVGDTQKNKFTEMNHIDDSQIFCFLNLNACALNSFDKVFARKLTVWSEFDLSSSTELNILRETSDAHIFIRQILGSRPRKSYACDIYPLSIWKVRVDLPLNPYQTACETWWV